MAISSSKWRWPAGLLLVVAAGAMLAFHFGGKAPPRPSQVPPVVVTTTQVQQHDIPMYLTGVGTVVPTQSVTVKTRIDGQLDNVGFTEGQEVEAGQLLAQLDPRVQQAQLAQTLAQKAKDESQLANARLDLRRYNLLIKQDATTRQILDAQRALVAQLDATVQADDAQINAARTQLSFTSIRAPLSGRAGARLVDPGNIVHAADENGLVVINQIDPISVVFTVPEESFQDINRALRTNAEPLVVEAYPRNGTQALGRGQLVLLNNQIDTSTGTVQLKGSFPNAEHVLWPGQYVQAHLILGQRKQALTVPSAVVQRGPDGLYAYVVAADNTVHIQAIQLAGTQDGLAVIAQGLSAGQRVVLDGQYKLKPGLRVTESHAPGTADAVNPARTTHGGVK